MDVLKKTKDFSPATKMLIIFGVVGVLAFIIFSLRALGETTVSLTLTTNPDLERGLVGHWTFDGKDITTDLIVDRSGQDNHGGFFGGATTSAATLGKIGQAFQFDGDNDYVDVSDDASLDFGTNSFTVMAWIKIEDAVQTTLVSKGFSGSAPSWYLTTLGSGVIRAGTQSSNTDFRLRDTTTTVNDNVWHHVVAVIRGFQTADVDIYIDGIVSDTSDLSGGSAQVTFNNDNPLFIGQRTHLSPGLYFNGQIDDVRVYNRALSKDEIKRLYGLGATTKVALTLPTNPDLESGLVGHWTFDGKDYEATRATDRSGNGNDGFLTELLLTSAESTTNWTTLNSTLATNADNVEGTNSLKLTATASDGIAKYNPSGTWDLSSYDYVVFWAKSGTGAAINDGEFFLFADTGDTNRFSWDFTYPADWAPVIIDLANPDDTNGTITLVTIDRIRFDVNTNGNSGLFDIVVATDKDKPTFGKIGQALKFDGVDDYVNIHDNASLQFGTGDFSVAAWFYFDGVDKHQQMITKRENGGNFAQFSLLITGAIYTGTNGKKLAMLLRPDGGSAGAPGLDDRNILSSDLSAGWHHGVIVNDYSSQATLYLDGVSVGTDSNSHNSKAFTLSGIPIRIGNNNGSNFFDDAIDDVRIYNRALSAEEIKRLYELGATTKVATTITTNPTLEDGLVGHWTFDGPDYEITRATDRSGNGNDGFLTELLLTDAESTTNWTTVNSTLATDSDNVEGSNSLKLTATANDGSAVYDPAGDWDLSSYDYVVFWAKSGTGSAIDDGEFFLFKDNTNDHFFRWDFTYPADWAPVVIDFANPDQTTGSPTLAITDRIRFDVDTSGNSGFFDITVGTDKDQPTFGKIGQALSFDGVDDYILNSTSNYQSGDSLGTVAGWFKTNSTASDLGIFSSADEATGNFYFFFGLRATDQACSLQQKNNDTASDMSGSSDIIDDAWHHCVFVSDGSSYRVYIDGQEETISVNAGSNNGDWFADTSNRDSFTIGNLRRSVLGAYFDGLIDDVRIYNRALSVEEIERLYELGR